MGGRVDPGAAQRGGGVAAELVEIPAALGDADHGHIKHAAIDKSGQRRESLKLGKIASGTEDEERVRPSVISGHCLAPQSAACRSRVFVAEPVPKHVVSPGGTGQEAGMQALAPNAGVGGDEGIAEWLRFESTASLHPCGVMCNSHAAGMFTP